MEKSKRFPPSIQVGLWQGLPEAVVYSFSIAVYQVTTNIRGLNQYIFFCISFCGSGVWLLHWILFSASHLGLRVLPKPSRELTEIGLRLPAPWGASWFPATWAPHKHFTSQQPAPPRPARQPLFHELFFFPDEVRSAYKSLLMCSVV